jgi:acetyltransferase-like isoleucine patch superfamily enzyme
MSISTKLYHLDRLIFSSFRRLRLQILGVKMGKNANLGKGISVFKDDKSQISIEDNCNMGKNVSLYAINGGKIEVKNNVRIDHHTSLFSRRGNIFINEGSIISSNCGINTEESSVKIGKDVLIAPGVDVMDRDHIFSNKRLPIKFQGHISKPVEIGDNCWLGVKVTVLKGVKIGKGSLIGANSVVTKNIPPYSIAVGAPAKVIKKR